MKPLTFKGFLKSYLTELSSCNSSAVTKLCKEVSSNLRLAEPLALYIKMTCGKEQINKINNKILNNLLNELSDISDVEKALQNNLLSSDFQKVYNSYTVLKNKKKREEQTKLLMLKKIKQMQQDKHITNYRIYTDLKLNAGNINDYLTNGKVDKLSLNTAEKILDYVYM